MSAARTVLGIDRKSMVKRAAAALRSRTTTTTTDDVWAVGEIKTLGGAEVGRPVELLGHQDCEHEWAEDQVFPEFVLRGCSKCPAMVRVQGAPEDMHDEAALEAWLNS